MTRSYQVLISQTSYDRAASYLRALQEGAAAGRYLRDELHGVDVASLTAGSLISALLRTKRPQIFAESAVGGDGRDWNQAELSILGDISVAMSVQVFDDGRHSGPAVHREPLRATLIFTPGALLRNGCGVEPADYGEVTRGGRIDPERYRQLYERRLLPCLIYANAVISPERQAIVTIPGLGCGQFAGKFQGQLGAALKSALQGILEAHAFRLPNLRAIYYDPYAECDNEAHQVDGVTLLVRPLTRGNERKPQLCQPGRYSEQGLDLSGCELVSLVAWDHVSWPGNDFYSGQRSTDDGVKAAATDALAMVTGVSGTYDPGAAKYRPQGKYGTWGQVVNAGNLAFELPSPLHILPPGERSATARPGQRLDAMGSDPRSCCLRVLQTVRELHRGGRQRLRIEPGVSASGTSWRLAIADVGDIRRSHGAMLVDHEAQTACYSSGSGGCFFGWPDAAGDDPARLAAKFVERFPELSGRGLGEDAAYAAWFREVVALAEYGIFPESYADWYEDPDPRWLPTSEGFASGLRMPPPGLGG